MTFEDKKSYYVNKYLSVLADPVKALRVNNEILSDESLDIQQQTEIFKEITRRSGIEVPN